MRSVARPFSVFRNIVKFYKMRAVARPFSVFRKIVKFYKIYILRMKGKKALHILLFSKCRWIRSMFAPLCVQTQVDVQVIRIAALINLSRHEHNSVDYSYIW
jgi:hypothetical protein